MSTAEEFVLGQDPWHGLDNPARPAYIRSRKDGPMKITQTAEIFNENAIQKAVDEFAHRHCIASGPTTWLEVGGYRCIVVPNSQDSLLAAGDRIQNTIEAVRNNGEDWVNFWYIVGRTNLDCDLAERTIAQDKRFETKRKGTGADTDVLVGLRRKDGEDDG